VTFKNAAGTVTKVIEYKYDSFDRLVRKGEDTTSTLDMADAVFEYYFYDGTDVIIELSDTDKAGDVDPVLAKRYLHGPSVDQVLAEETASGNVLSAATEHACP
jgi:hypothetical protein